MQPKRLGIALALLAVTVASAALLLSDRSDEEPVPSAESPRPNVLIVLWDTVRADRLSVYGYDKPTTPHLEALAAESVVFERALSPGIWTLSSHASVFTGLPPESTGADERWLWLDEQHTTLAEHFGANGYETFAFAANALLSEDTNLVQGFDVVLNTWKGKVRPIARAATEAKLLPADRSNELSPDWQPPPHGAKNAEWARAVYKEAGPIISEGLLRWIDGRDDERPWLAYLNLMEAHTPRIPSMEARRKVMDPALIDLSLQTDQAHINLHFYNFGKHGYTPEQLRAINGVYDATLVELDQITADLLDALDRRGVLDDTIVVITSDHGENLGDHGLFNHRLSLADTLAHVPLIVHYPRGLAPRRVDDPVSTQDLFGTLVDLAELPAPTGPFRSDSLFDEATRTPVTYMAVPLEREIRTVQKVHPDVEVEPWLKAGHAVHGSPHKLVRWSTGARELYDITADPREQADLLPGAGAVAQPLEAALQALIDAAPPYDPSRRGDRDQPRNVRANQDDLRNQLEALGYIQGDEEGPEL